MRIGVFGRTFPGGHVGRVLDAVRAAGFDGVHWNMASAGLASVPETVPEGLPGRIAVLARERGLAVEGLSATTNLAHPDPAARAESLRRLLGLIEAARVMGAPVVTLCTGSRDAEDMWRGHPGNADPSAWADLRAGLEQAIPAAEAAGLLLGIEPEPGNVVSGPEAAARLLGEMPSPALAIVLDPANLFEGPLDAGTLRDRVSRAVDLLGPRIRVVHGKDRDAMGEVVAAGRGIVDWPHLAGLLSDIGFDGPVVAHGLTAEEAPAVARHLRAVFG